MKTIIFLILGINLQIQLLGQNVVNFVWDKNSSSISSAENLLSLHTIISDFENAHLKLRYWDESHWKGKTLGIGYRLAKTVLLDFQLDYLTNLVQHEVFGHGYRYREFGYEGNSFNLNLAPPYGPAGGFARTGSLPYARSFGVHERIMRNSGGMEADAVFSKTLQSKWLSRGTINYRETLIYLIGLHDYTSYILSTKIFSADQSSNDVNNYLRRLNQIYGYIGVENHKLTLDDLSNRVVVNFLNTYSLFAMYTYLKVYLFDGNSSFNIPMIKLGKMNWLPAIRFGLTPFGSEFIIDNHLKMDKKIIWIIARVGDNTFEKFWGAGISYHTKISSNLQLNTSFDLWNQPSLELGGTSVYRSKEGFGGRFLGGIQFHFDDSFPLGIYSQIGYKSAGHFEGEDLGKGLIMRIGISIKK